MKSIYSRMHKQIDDLFYYSFDRLTSEDRAMLQNILQELKALINKED